MTPLSRNCLVHFLNKYGPRILGPVADYGGADENVVEEGEVRKVFASGGITDYHVLDYSTGTDLMKPIKGRKFRVGICMDLLEHVSNPFVVAENITNSLERKALLFVTVPFIWGLHEFPKDYFRFTVDGIKSVFGKMRCLESDFLSDVPEGIPAMVKRGDHRHWSTRVVAVFEKK